MDRGIGLGMYRTAFLFCSGTLSWCGRQSHHIQCISQELWLKTAIFPQIPQNQQILWFRAFCGNPLKLRKIKYQNAQSQEASDRTVRIFCWQYLRRRDGSLTERTGQPGGDLSKSKHFPQIPQIQKIPQIHEILILRKTRNTRIRPWMVGYPTLRKANLFFRTITPHS